MRVIDAFLDWRRRRAGELTCQRAVELMTDYVEGAMDDAARARFEAHLDHCDACTRYLEQLRATIDVLGRVEPPVPDAAVRDGLVDLYRRYRAG